ncbi:MAG: hypothetical protein KJI71_00455 [Patescibacteria group bacterium]|nr:hypothetical protein [Patescibacteria group bacterium]
MEYEKKRISEKIRDKKEDFSNWKNNRFDPWYKHTFKPIVKRAKKDTKRGIKKAVKSYRKHRKERLKRKYSHPDNYNINIKNIEHIENFDVGGKHQKQLGEIAQNRQLPNAYPPNVLENQNPNVRMIPQKNRLTYQPNNNQKPNMELDKLADWYDEIQYTYNSGYYSEVITQCNNFFNYFLSRLAKYLNIGYSSVDDFLLQVHERGLRFQFYEELDEYRRHLRVKTHKIGESACMLFEIISKIIRRLYEIASTPH